MGISTVTAVGSDQTICASMTKREISAPQCNRYSIASRENKVFSYKIVFL